ncbi:putative cyclin-dependent serine/threonine-protein kinase DDB_G0272797/DDB_G0274007 [Frankliniella occidentalis]|uniref:Cyclin-dependent serine/threonine-protein kinase DDB_G0272797/DDB_G0274007 n=1 Tax=Frankliniella occidentalis TaxID=133901 RepID=A0A9C6XTW1_FRAOC|nr:putative cyclin-dependent serine/threonine-protein kinase DDB_G0272797/DDB_G0274007 [Frankliniella occidentalis]
MADLAVRAALNSLSCTQHITSKAQHKYKAQVFLREMKNFKAKRLFTQKQQQRLPFNPSVQRQQQPQQEQPLILQVQLQQPQNRAAHQHPLIPQVHHQQQHQQQQQQPPHQAFDNDVEISDAIMDSEGEDNIKCKSCRTISSASKGVTLEKLPPIVCLHFKR